MCAFLKQVPVTVKAIDNGFIFDIIVTLQQGSDSAVVRICQYHTNIVLIQRNSEVLLDHTAQETKQLCGDAAPAESGLTDRALLNIADIFAFADTCEIDLCWKPRSGTTPASRRRDCEGITVRTSALQC